MKKTEKSKKNNVVKSEVSNSRISQSDIPSCSLDKALSVGKTIMDNYAGKGASPLQVAKGLKVQPTSGPFRALCGASIAYGLTKGGYNVDEITLEPLAIRIFKPKTENDDITARIEAFLKPRIINEFFTKYNGAAIPRDDIAKNVLEDMGVPKDRVQNIFMLIIEQGEELGIIFNLKDKKYIDLKGGNKAVDNKLDVEELDGITAPEEENNDGEYAANITNPVQSNKNIKDKDISDRLKKVFITHGKNTKFIEPIKKLLSFGELTAVVSVEKTTISQPVPDKVMNDMRSCGAAIIHVEDELKLIDDKANEHKIINSNVLIEIGGAMALYGRRFILLVKEGINLPSNLQGLFEVRYTGEALDGNATIKLMEAINDIKNQPLPNP